MNILVCYGTRPELIKIKPLLAAFNQRGISYKTLRIEQHTTLIGGTEKDDYTVAVPYGFNRLDAILGAANCIPDSAFVVNGITHVLVQGDTATAFVCSMAAFHRNVPVIHLEAGLRTYDKQNPYPEETYRQLVSRVASIHLCPTDQNAKNLNQEGITNNVFVVGNTVLDNLVDLRQKTTCGNEILITLHRRENHPIMDQWFSAINEIAKVYSDCVFTLPIHPNPNVQKHKHLLTHVNVIDPLPYDMFIERLLHCRFAISDSGGIQEEVSFLGKKAIVCRVITERPESLGANSFLCRTTQELTKMFEEVNKAPYANQSNVYGDGNASHKIAQILKGLST